MNSIAINSTIEDLVRTAPTAMQRMRDQPENRRYYQFTAVELA
jgi:hypothetical protein